MAVINRRLGQILIEQGLAPANARNVELIMPADDLLVLRYEILLEQSDLPKIVRAFELMQHSVEPMPECRFCHRRDVDLNGDGVCLACVCNIQADVAKEIR